MTDAVITKTLEKISKEPMHYSLGFRRYICLPQRVKKNMGMASVLKGEYGKKPIYEFLNEFTDQEFLNWMKLA